MSHQLVNSRKKSKTFGKLRDATSTSRLHENNLMGLPGLLTAEAEDNTALRRVLRASASWNQHHCHQITTTTGYSLFASGQLDAISAFDG
ncbi:hypothetical protein CABS01_02239 [Colletotrichum abscissum]|uniref:Uncharacterized protein n=1 Tax=Colletotrichum cuscutae TaxID=1209917 RepID=A0AAI9UXX0_9PEZI|nr:uncharacterized protein CABS01_02239 [Colletotrichum abscissum]KAK1466559.1 hypothetical protein CCUS01_07380 [Colletotrichum cuscutae]KAK1488609.1 hypothetical protein CABS01_02239 [Colletotrichum abscissum]